MAVTETYRALGSWSIQLRPNTPRTVLDALTYFGHVAVSAGRDNPKVAGDSLLASARYVGVLRGVTNDANGHQLSGAGMAFWLGDEDNKGSVIENLVTLTSSTFTNAVRSLLPSSGSVTEGTLHSVTGTYTGTHQYQSPRQAIDYVCQTMGAAWRMNGNGTLDAGLASDLFVTTPVAAVTSRSSGVDMSVRGLPGAAALAEDVQDFTTRVVLLAQGAQGSTATGSADISGGLNPYKDIHGNTVKLTRLVSESSTDQGNATARAQLALNQFTSPRDAVTLNSTTHDIRGDVAIGDYVWVFDPDAGLFNLNNEVVFRGERINPLKLQVTALSWPVEAGMGVAYRDPTGAWVDLTDYVVFESGQVNITVGGYDRSLTNTGTEPVGSRPQQNTSIPGVPTFTTPFTQAVYQSTNSGITKAQVQVTWSQPNNTDGSSIIDGDHYEVRYRTSSTPIWPSTWSQVSGLTWSQMATWGQPITYVAGPWQYISVGWDNTSCLIQELTPGLPYDIQIRAVDNGTPANYSDWSASTSIQTNGDTIAPETPAPPSVAASLIAVQVTHTLGAASGGTYNLAADLHHLEVHAQYEPTFTPSDSTRLGKLLANNGMMISQIPVVGTFQVQSTSALWFKVIAVDEAGNKSNPSTAVQATANLIDDAHISSLTVSKITAGTISSDFIVGSRIKTADTGPRVELNSSGLQAFNASGAQTVNVASADGSVSITGTLQSGSTGQRVVVNPEPNSLARIDIYDDSTTTTHVTEVMFSGNFLMQRENNGNRVANGGYFQWQNDGTSYFGHQDATAQLYILFNSGNDHIDIKGKISPGGFDQAMLEVGDWGGGITSSAISATVTYPATKIGTMLPFVAVGANGADFDWCVTASSTTGFTVGLGNHGGGGTRDIWWWSART